MKNIEQDVQNTKNKISGEIKNGIFDIIAIVIVGAVIIASLDVFGMVDIYSIDWVEFLIGWMPYLFAALLLHTDLYKKGIFVGKKSNGYLTIVDNYSNIVNAMSGADIKGLYPFCENYNREALKTLQTKILFSEGISYEDFIGDSEHKGYKTMSKKELIATKLTPEQIKCVRKAKRAKVKGITVNTLLSSIATKDETYIGVDEKGLERKRAITYAMKYVLRTFLLTLVAVNDVSEWGWAGILVVVFKVSYIFAGCYISYFKAYSDVTVNLASYYARKTDILKMYLDK